MKKRSRWLAFLLAAAMSIGTLSGCGGGGSSAETQAPAATTAAAAEDGAADAAASGDVAGITEAIAEGPIILTSVGQSADVNVVQTLLTKCEIESDLNATMTADDLAGYKTLVLAIGGSSKA